LTKVRRRFVEATDELPVFDDKFAAWRADLTPRNRHYGTRFLDQTGSVIVGDFAVVCICKPKQAACFNVMIECANAAVWWDISHLGDERLEDIP
jgi:hypothetical protein